MTKTIFIDLDVLADSRHRESHRQDRDIYDSMAEYDALNKNVAEILEIMGEFYEIVVFSIMNESYRLGIEEWLLENSFTCDELLLREQGDYSKGYELRKSFVLDHFKNEQAALDKTQAVFTNDERSIELLRELGFLVISTDWN